MVAWRGDPWFCSWEFYLSLASAGGGSKKLNEKGERAGTLSIPILGFDGVNLPVVLVVSRRVVSCRVVSKRCRRCGAV